MVSRGVISREFAGWSSFVKLQILLTPCLHEVRRLFLFMAFQPLLVTYLHTVVVATFFWKNGHPLFDLSFEVFTFDYLFTYCSDFFNSLAIFLTEWPEDRKNRCLSKQCRPSFSWKRRKNKWKKQKYEKRKPTKWEGKLWREKTRVLAHFGKTSKIL